MSKYFYLGADGKLHALAGNTQVVGSILPENVLRANNSALVSSNPSTTTQSQNVVTVQQSASASSSAQNVTGPSVSAVSATPIRASKSNIVRSKYTASVKPPVTSNQARITNTENSQVTTVDLTKKIKNPRIQDIIDDPDCVYSIESKLLEEVFNRPPLFDSSLSMMERAVDVKIRLYKEIAMLLMEEFETNIEWQVVKNTWDQHRTLHIRYINAKKQTLSGSGPARLPNAPSHFHIMQKYNVVIEKREQKSSLSKDGLSMYPPVKRIGKQEAVGKYLKTATTFLESLKPTTSTAPTASTSTSTYTQPNLTGANPNLIFFNSILSDIEKLKPKDERALKKTIIDTVYCYLDKYEEEKENVQDENQRPETDIRNGKTTVEESANLNDRPNQYDAYYGMDVYSDED